MISRIIEKNLISRLFNKKAVVLYGPRQVGKSTLLRKISVKYQTLYLDGEEFATQESLYRPTIAYLQGRFSDIELLIIDEAQKIPEIGSTLKLLVDHLPNLQVIASGSSSFDLANKLNEPLTGRKWTLRLYPISLMELVEKQERFLIASQIAQYLIFGMYPKVVESQTKAKSEEITELVESYLYKDILNFSNILDRSTLFRLLKLLALQLGSEVSFHELATNLGIDQATVKKYLTILEKSFVIKTLSAYSNNPRVEITKKKKVYFWDNGVRNAIIGNFLELDNRNDVGALWENFCVMERIKFLEYSRQKSSIYFWRSYKQKEVDFLEEANGSLQGFEFKYNPRKRYKIPTEFQRLYPEAKIKVINLDNFWDLLG